MAVEVASSLDRRTNQTTFSVVTDAFRDRLVGGPPIGWRLLTAYAFLMGAGAGAAEAIYLTLRHLIRQELASWYFPEVLWMAPVAAGLGTVVVALMVGGLARLMRLPLDLGAASFLLMLPLVISLASAPGVILHPAAELLLCLGVAIAFARFARSRSDWLGRRIPRFAAATGIALLVLTAAGLLQLPVLRERRALANLPAAAGTTNVLLIILDTVRASNLSLYGYARETSPNLDEWAAAGVTFDRAVSTAPWTLPSHTSMFTGHYNITAHTGFQRALDGRHQTLAEALSARGYATAGFVANFGYTTRVSGLSRGFARYEDFPVTHGMFLRSAWLPRQLARYLARATGFPHWSVPKNAEALTREFESWLDDRPARPFFVFLNYYDAHGPYEAPPEWRSRFGPPPEEEATAERPHTPAELATSVNAYDGCIAYVDAQLAHVRQLLERHGLTGNTLVVITSDHGEMFGEHGQTAHTSGLYMPALWVPLTFVFPGTLPAGERIATPVSLRDLPATIADIVGLRHQTPFPGTPLAGLWQKAGDHGAPSPLLSEIDTYDWAPEWTPIHRGDMKSIVEGSLHYIRNGDGVEELYDAAADPAESVDLSASPAHEPALRRIRMHLDSLLR